MVESKMFTLQLNFPFYFLNLTFIIKQKKICGIRAARKGEILCTSSFKELNKIPGKWLGDPRPSLFFFKCRFNHLVNAYMFFISI